MSNANAMRRRNEVRRAIENLAVEEYGGERIDRSLPALNDLRPMTVPDVTPLAGLRAARFTEQASRVLVREYVVRARAAGESWRAVGEAVGLGGDYDGGATAVYEMVAIDHGRVDSVSYRCGTCEERIIDRGPDIGHPTDSEEGHADDCPRLAALVAAWTADEFPTPGSLFPGDQERPPQT